MIITVHIKPSARKNEIVWLDETTAKISVTAAPEKGRANEAMIEILASSLKIAKSRLQIVRGATTRLKQVCIDVDS